MECLLINWVFGDKKTTTESSVLRRFLNVLNATVTRKCRDNKTRKATTCRIIIITCIGSRYRQQPSKTYSDSSSQPLNGFSGKGRKGNIRRRDYNACICMCFSLDLSAYHEQPAAGLQCLVYFILKTKKKNSRHRRGCRGGLVRTMQWKRSPFFLSGEGATGVQNQTRETFFRALGSNYPGSLIVFETLNGAKSSLSSSSSSFVSSEQQLHDKKNRPHRE